MPKKRNKDVSKVLTEQIVRNDELFCSLLYDELNSTLRVVDFRGGNFQEKHTYIKRIQAAEGFRKAFTLIERDDIQGWQRCGYAKEGSIPGYYRRSDAYFMGWLAGESWSNEEYEAKADDRKDFVEAYRDLGVEYESYKTTGFVAESLTVEEVPEVLKKELERQNKKSKSKAAKKPELIVPSDESPLFSQFSRDVDYFYFSTTNTRSGQVNLLVGEYQDCFGNAKVDVYFDDVKTKTEIAQVRHGLIEFSEWLREMGAVAVFSLVDANNAEMNAIMSSCGFKYSGWISEQVLDIKGNPSDQILWTFKHAI